ncbi:MAG: hypothetical protein E7183_04640 [Erysipelotrichaceae bacterium]|nr:hypothetical protein [Erysipelotrichaceae bacterium]
MKNLKNLFMLIMIVSLIFLTGCNEKHVHNYEEVIIEPTCTQNGYIKKICECGDNYIEKELSSKGHTFGEWVIIKEATKETLGLQEKKCINCEYKEEENITYNYNEYLDYYFDENISVTTQIIEKRKNSNQAGNDYEESVYDLYFYIKKTSSFDLQNIRVYVDVKTKDGIKSSKSITSKDLQGPMTIVSTISITNFLVNKVVIEEGKIKNINEIPEFLYFKISYNIIVNEQVESCELNYKIKYDDVTKESFNGYEQRQVVVSSSNTTQYVDYKNDYVSMKFLKVPVETSGDTVKYSDYRLSNVKIVKNNLPKESSISKIKVEVFAEIGNEAILTKDYFSKYVKLFVYEGALAADITSSRTSSLADEYEVEKIYFNVEIELDNGDSANYKFYVLTSDLLEK